VNEELLGDLEVSGYYTDVDKCSDLLIFASVDWYLPMCRRGLMLPSTRSSRIFFSSGVAAQPGPWPLHF